ncbi:hypothetical protein AUK40_01930 [Candidatus Wirthbacteria bacterium CG2_30_54_11]|uniref:DNA-binding response regulator n=1 Tax=Candidatus Wirthbacteria bacterium CG2_30_54_11 TaxID=1817892 RepID=A0A1J5ILV4_9BACT|nr:MAG: hypothetical protein AUK40_01930 [Candidatus Wirthbacteria bacterium CG2_30_54_11]
MRILIVEDDATIGLNIQTVLRRESYAVDQVATAEEAAPRVFSEPYDLLILDWRLPGMSGIDLCGMIRKEGSTVPVLMLTSRSQIEDRVQGLDTGADDYLTKPFDMNELVARVRALLRRPAQQTKDPVISVGKLTLDTNTQTVRYGKETIEFAPREYALLEYLARHHDVVLDRMDIMSHVWDENADPFSNTVDVHIRYLRRKLDGLTKNPLIRTIKGKGYMLCAE